MSLQADPTVPDVLSLQPRLRLVEEPTEHVAETHPSLADATTSAHAYRTGVRITDSITVAVPVIIASLTGLTASGLPLWAESASLGYWQATGLAIAVWMLALWLVRARDPRILGAGRSEFARVTLAGSTTFVVLAVAHLLFDAELGRWLFVFAIPGGIAGLVAGRSLWRLWLKAQVAKGRPLARVILVGPRADVEYVLRQIASGPAPSYRVVGAVIDGGQPSETLGDGIPVSADLLGVPGFASQVGADAVIVAGTIGARDAFIRELAWHLERSETGLMIVSVPANVGDRRLCMRAVGGLSLVDVQIASYSGGKHALKRAIDIAGSALALVLLLPLMLLIALVIKFESPGPALFRQQRVGRGGQPFSMLKFRSMQVSADDALHVLLDRNEAAGPLFKIRNDPRVTRVGRVIRRHSLDELPQLWNILKGNMSIVGPRPPLPTEVQRYDDDVQRRLNLRPGLTGVWQISGRSMLSWDRSVELDLYYVENWTVWGDILIMVRTLRQLTHPVGAF